MTFLRRTYRFLQRIFSPTSQRRAYKIVFTLDKPEQPLPHAVYIVGERRPWLLIMLCPCGCEARIHLNLLPEDLPFWRVTQHSDGTLSVHPSIWRTTGCRSHFFLRRSSIVWHYEP